MHCGACKSPFGDLRLIVGYGKSKAYAYDNELCGWETIGRILGLCYVDYNGSYKQHSLKKRVSENLRR